VPELWCVPCAELLPANLKKCCSLVPLQGLAALEHCSLAAQPAFTFWDLFYPWVLWYLIFYYLKGAQWLSDQAFRTRLM